MDKTNYPGAKEQQSANAPMEQVREILFGAQLKDMELRFRRQEERFLREIHDVKDSLRKRLDSLENFMKSEVSSLLDRLKRENEERGAEQKAEQRERLEAIQTEQRERAEALKTEQRERAEALKAEERDRQEAVARLSGDLASASETFERKLAKLSGTLDSAERDLRSLLLSESGSLTDKIESKYADALNVMARTAAQIRADMVYRAALSGMFAEMVGGLSKAWNDENLATGAGQDREEGPAPAGQEEPPQEYQPGGEEEPENELPQVAQVGSADNY
ncbi:MAG: hypothetical protein LBP33_09350 [Candidatus Adiutrix sp.]|jgi:DNA repair exonuclease SbcCD ATPase subunit|nr:hypothetical protein [Candidatus Adiutrix sp.]